MAGSFAERFAAARARYGPLVLGADPHAQVLADWGLPDDADGLERFTDIVLAAADGTVGLVKGSGAAVLVVVRSSNSEGRAVQSAAGAGGMTVERRLLADIAALNARLAPGRLGPVGAVVGPEPGLPPLDLAAVFNDKAGLAVDLEFLAALLRSPAALARYSAGLQGRLAELAAADDSAPLPGTSPVQSRAIGHALLIGLQVYRCIAPEVVTPEAFSRAFELLAGPDAGGRA